MPECFLCAKVIEGDADFFQFHLNACLDSPSAPSPPAPSASLDYLAAIYNDDDEVESSIALARQLSQEEQARFPDAHDGCPLCGHTWNELSLSNDAEKESHADGCAYVPQTQSQEYQSRDETEDSSDEEPIASGSTGSTGFVLGRGGEKDAVIGTTNIIPLLYPMLVRAHDEGKTRTVYLCNEKVEHVATKLSDLGWGCGYRNAQMIFSALRHLPCYKNLIPPAQRTFDNLTPIPTIPELQDIIERAWKAGFDPPGADHFRNKLRGSRKWIGTTEIYTALTFMGVRARVIDFPKVPGSDGTHAALVKWILDYFSNPPANRNGKKRVQSTAFEKIQESPIKLTDRQPLYLQHEGHSRTVVGIDQGKGNDWLLIFDPGKSISGVIKKVSLEYVPPSDSPNDSPPSKRQKPLAAPIASTSKLSAFFKESPGEAKIWGMKSSDRKVGELEPRNYAKHLEPFRTSLRSLSKRQEYQVLYVEEGAPLTEAEKGVRKVVASSRIVS